MKRHALVKRYAFASAFALPLGLSAALALPATAEARMVKVTTTLKNYGGDGAYLAIYVTDGSGKLQKSIHVAGGKAKYHKHLAGWYRQSGGRLDGTTGASVGAGGTLSVSVDLADSLIDAGYQIRVDTAVEKENDVPADVVAPLSSTQAGKPSPGKGYVKTLVFDM